MGAGSPDLDLAMAVEMSQLYTYKKGDSTKACSEIVANENGAVEEKELSLAIELSLKEVNRKNRQSRFSAKSISTDGTEGELARNVQEKVPVHFPNISEEASETVR